MRLIRKFLVLLTLNKNVLRDRKLNSPHFENKLVRSTETLSNLSIALSCPEFCVITGTRTMAGGMG